MNALIVAMAIAAVTGTQDNIIAIKLNDDIEASASDVRFVSETNKSIDAVAQLNEIIAASPGTTIHPLVPNERRTNEQNLRARLEAASRRDLPHLEQWFYLDTQSAEEAARVLKKIRSSGLVKFSYIQPTPVNAAAVDIPPTTPSLGEPLFLGPTGIDHFIGPGPSGVNGEFCSVYDIERAMRMDHEDVDYASAHPTLGLMSAVLTDIEHGTMVLGVLRGENNAYGFRGAIPLARVGLATPLFGSVAAAINASRSELIANGRSTKVILIEQQYMPPGGPIPGTTSCTPTNTQCGMVPVEFVQAEFDAIVNAVAAGVTVVEAAGNGAVNLDHSAFASTLARESGAILVGATVGGATTTPASFSNFGSRVRLNGWGGSVETTECSPSNGITCIFPPGTSDRRQAYTSLFSGTSSASPQIVSAVCALQGYSLFSRGSLLSNAELQQRLIASTLQSAPSSVGVRPSIRRAVRNLGRADVLAVDAAAGSWFVATSNGSSFGGSFPALTSWAVGASAWTRLVGDFNGDGATDIVAKENNATSRWYVATGGPTGFTPNVPWLSGWATGTGYALAAGDWNGDGTSDLLAIELASPYRWYTAMASGITFTPQLPSISSNVNGLVLLVGDVNKDGRDDVILKSATGTWTVATSTGTGFSTPTTFCTGWAVGNYFVSVGDYDGDGRADIYAKEPVGSNHYVALSTGTAFAPQLPWLSSWAAGSNWAVLTGDFTGEGRADVTVKDLSPPGDWHVSTSTGTAFSPQPVWLSGGWALGNYLLFTGNFDGK